MSYQILLLLLMLMNVAEGQFRLGLLMSHDLAFTQQWVEVKGGQAREKGSPQTDV